MPLLESDCLDPLIPRVCVCVCGGGGGGDRMMSTDLYTELRRLSSSRIDLAKSVSLYHFSKLSILIRLLIMFFFARESVGRPTCLQHMFYLLSAHFLSPVCVCGRGKTIKSHRPS